MAYNNKVILVGNLGEDPVEMTNQDGSTRVEVRIATQDSYLDKDSGQWIDLPAIWHKVVFFGPQSKQHALYYRKGQRVSLEATIGYYKITGADSKEYWVASLRGERIDAAPLPKSKNTLPTAESVAPTSEEEVPSAPEPAPIF